MRKFLITYTPPRKHGTHEKWSLNPLLVARNRSWYRANSFKVRGLHAQIKRPLVSHSGAVASTFGPQGSPICGFCRFFSRTNVICYYGILHETARSFCNANNYNWRHSQRTVKKFWKLRFAQKKLCQIMVRRLRHRSLNNFDEETALNTHARHHAIRNPIVWFCDMSQL